ncbi:MAG: glycosyltransferase family 39 protein [Dehalococcoidia bacterium]|nr:glycosyltransferase family 39 protein [Dehalococcoidia bacterium]
MTRLRAVGEAAAVIGAVAAFLALATHQIDLPGLYYDEAADAVPAMQIVLGQPVELFRGAGVWFGDRAWPLMVMDYVGAVSTYLLVGSIAIFGVTVEAVRAMPIAFGVVALLLAYGFLRGAVGVPAALIALWLVAVTPSFVFWTRQGVHVSSIMLVCSTAVLWLGLAWWRRGGWWRLALAGFLLGLGVSIKLLFIWYPVALLATALVLRPPLLARRFWLRWQDAPAVALGVALSVVGAGFLIIYNLQTQGTLQVLMENATQTSYGVDNRAFFANLLTRLDAFAAYLRGENFWYFGQLFANPLTVGVFVVASVALAALTALDPAHRARWRVPAFFGVMIAVIIAQSTVTVSSLSATHFYLLYPLPQAIIALAVVWSVVPALWF